MCGSIEDVEILENNDDYVKLIERKAENMYRTINQKVPSLPASNQAVKQKVYMTKNIDLTPQETEQLSKYASDDAYVQRQKEDISELTKMFKDMMGSDEKDDSNEFIKEFEEAFHPEPGIDASYLFHIEGKKLPLYMVIEGLELKMIYKEAPKVDVEITVSKERLSSLVKGSGTFQRAFMAGEMSIKGDFNALRELDKLFIFS
jgi:putative sterol carrier protein